MELAVVYANIIELLETKGLSADKVSRDAGVPDAIRNIKRRLDGGIKSRSLNIQTLDALAAQLGVTADYLKANHDQPQSTPGSVREAILAKIAWLDRERAQAMAELSAIDQAATRKPKRKAARG